MNSTKERRSIVMFNGNDQKVQQAVTALKEASSHASMYALLRLALRGFPMHEVSAFDTVGQEIGLFSSRILITGIVYFQEPNSASGSAFERACDAFVQWANRPIAQIFRKTTIGYIAKGTVPVSDEALWRTIHYSPFILHPAYTSLSEREHEENLRSAFLFENDLLDLLLQDLRGSQSFASGSYLWPKSFRPDVHDVTLQRIEDMHPQLSSAFWKKWHSSFLDGRPLDWDLQRRVSLIADDIWEAGPEAVAEEIARIEAQWLTEQAPLAETVALNPDTQKFHLIPTPVQNPPLTTTLVSRVQDALDDAMMGHNGLNERSTIARKLSRTCTRYANDPQRIEMDFTSAATSLRRQMYDTRDLPDSEDNLLLLETVEEGVRGIRASHPDVAENRATLAGLAVQELSEEDKATLAQARPILDTITEDTLQEDFAQDIPQLLNTSIGPLPDGASALPGMDASLRTFTRASRIKLLIDGIDDWHDGKTHKAATLFLGATSLGTLLYQLIQIGLKVLGVL